jgi:hypothetical protein
MDTRHCSEIDGSVSSLGKLSNANMSGEKGIFPPNKFAKVKFVLIGMIAGDICPGQMVNLPSANWGNFPI